MALARIFGVNRQGASSEPGSRAGVAPAARGCGAAADGADAAEAVELVKNFEEAGHGWFWSTGAEGQITYISEQLARAIGHTRESLLGSRFAELFEQADDDLTGRRALPFILARHSSFDKVTVKASQAVDERFWAVAGTPQHGGDGAFSGYRGVAVDVTEQRRSSEHASQLARYDSLTGLPNRRGMAEVLDRNLVGIAHHRRACTVMLIDLDRFKQVNDTLGHPAGDALLKQVAERLCRIAGDSERVFRLGGDEFQVIVPGSDDRGEIGELASQIIASLSQPYSIEGSRCIIGASIGIAIAPADGADRSELIRNADLALYASKDGGRGRFHFFSSELLEAAEERRALEEDLRDAIARGEMSIWYQPVVDARSNHITGVEALLRWQHKVRGAISPAMFIPIAEEAGLIPQIGEWVLRQACHDAVTWPGKLRVAVNISPLQFANDALPATVVSALAASGLAPDRLELEITEGVFLAASASTDTAFETLKEIGVRLALDDFGTGYSSLGYLRTAPFDKIKIDQTFVREATVPGSKNGAIIAAIVALAEALGMETTAEGIEYMDQLALIRRLRVSHVQGWVYSKALPCEELVGRLERGEMTLTPAGPAKQRSERQAVYRAVGVIQDGRYSSAIMRNLSDTGALVEGGPSLAVGALIIVDFGDGQLTYAHVTRLVGRQVGISFSQPLVPDGGGGWCTSRRASAYQVASLGLPSPGSGDVDLGGDGPQDMEALAQKLGLTLTPRPAAQGTVMNLRWSQAGPIEGGAATVADVAARYLENMTGDAEARDAATRDLRDHILPQFGRLRLDQVSRSDVIAWLTAKGDAEAGEPGTDTRLHALMNQMWKLAAKLELPGSETNPLEGSLRFDRRGVQEAVLTQEQAERLLTAAGASANRQLKFILALLMLTGARPRELLTARWESLDLEAGYWRVATGGGTTHDLRLSPAAITLLRALPRSDDCPYLIPNPVTRRPFGSVAGSWEAVKAQLQVHPLELDDLRFCDLGAEAWETSLLALLLDEDGCGPSGLKPSAEAGCS